MDFGGYNCLPIALYNELMGLGIDEITEFLESNKTGEIKVKGEVAFVTFGNIDSFEWFGLLEENEIEPDSYVFEYFAYLKSTWSFVGF